MAQDDRTQSYERCISCGRLITMKETARHLHGFPIHVECYEKELGIPKQRSSADDDAADDD